VLASSSLPLPPHHWRQSNGEVGAKDAAGSATVTAKFVNGIIACFMVGHDGPHCFAAERLQQHYCCINNNNNNDDQH
jgi:hypothetical protein